MHPFRFRAAPLLFAAAVLAACTTDPDPRDKYKIDCGDFEVNGVLFTNYDGVKSDSTSFTLVGFTASLGDTVDVTGNVFGPYSKSGYYLYGHVDASDGFVTFELYKDAEIKARATFEVTAQRGGEPGGEGCDAGTTTQRKYSVVWLETVDEDGYTEVIVTEEE